MKSGTSRSGWARRGTARVVFEPFVYGGGSAEIGLIGAKLLFGLTCWLIPLAYPFTRLWSPTLCCRARRTLVPGRSSQLERDYDLVSLNVCISPVHFAALTRSATRRAGLVFGW